MRVRRNSSLRLLMGLFFWVAFIPVLFAQQERVYFDKYWNDCGKDEASYYREIETIDGGYLLKDYYKSGSLQMEGKSTNKEIAVPFGEVTWFHENGQKSKWGTYIDNEKTGKWEEYFEDGTLASVYFYEDGKPYGTWKSWYENGQQKSEYQFNAGKRTGQWKAWYVDGTVKTAARYLDDHASGKWYGFQQNGQVDVEGSYGEKGKTDQWRWFHPNGQLAAIKKFHNDSVRMEAYYQEDGTKEMDKKLIEQAPSMIDVKEAVTEHLNSQLEPKNWKGDQVRVNCIIDKSGQVSKAHIMLGLPNRKENIQLREALLLLPKWSPGRANNRAVEYAVDMTINRKKNKLELGEISYTKIENIFSLEGQFSDVYLTPEEMPHYIGGLQALFQYLGTSTKYPVMAMDGGIQGTVYVSFVVMETGKVDKVKLLRGIGGGCDEESLRVVQNMPDWKPGRDKGKPVRVQMRLPVKFILR